MLDLKDLKFKLEVAEKCATMAKAGEDKYNHGFQRGYACAIREVIADIEEEETELSPEDYEHIAIIVTPNKSVAMLVHRLNEYGELGTDFDFTGKGVYKDANNDHWIRVDGEVLPFDIELCEIIKGL